MNDSFSVEAKGPTTSYKMAQTTTTQSIKTANIDGYQEAAQRYELRKSSKSQQGTSTITMNQQSTIVRTQYEEQDQKARNDLNQLRESSRIVIDKYQPSTSYRPNQNRTVDQVINQYSAKQSVRGNVNYQVSDRRNAFENQEQTLYVSRKSENRDIFVNEVNEVNEGYEEHRDEKQYRAQPTLKSVANDVGNLMGGAYDDMKDLVTIEPLNQLRKPVREPNQRDVDFQEGDYVSCQLI